MTHRWKATLLVASLLGAGVQAQDAKDLLQDAQTPEDVLVHGMGYSNQRFTPLKQINASNVARLAPVWSQGLANLQGQEAMPLLHQGRLYITTHDSTLALDALSGEILWKTMLDYAPDVPRTVCCGLVNRGAALYRGVVYRGTLDAQVQALDAATGKELWKTRLADYHEGYSVTGAPLLADGVLISGMSGGEYGTRGFLVGLDPKTGQELWRFHTTAAPGEPGGDTWPGETHKLGGGSTWITGSYDPELGLVYWGTGNPGPFNAGVRKGDNLYTASVVALQPRTGKLVWHYQFTPNDSQDYDGVNELVQAELDIQGARRKVIMQANRNGFFYVIDRKTGKLLAANPFIDKINWAERIDLATGRPVLSDIGKRALAGEAVEVQPSAFGGKNWAPMAYNPLMNRAFLNTNNFSWDYKAITPEYKKGEWYLGIDFKGFKFADETRGYLKAVDPLTGRTLWQVPRQIPAWTPVMATASGLVFTGTFTGEFEARDGRDGRLLWSYRTGSAPMGQPIAWSHAGQQYITVLSGIGGAYTILSGDERLAKVPAGGMVWTFAVK